MTTMMHENGRKRLSLNEQIDRLDKTLDGLADGLNEAVADAVKAAVGQAVREAVQTALTEVLGNPEVLAKLAPVAIANEPKQPAPSCLRERLHRLWAAVRGGITALRLMCGKGIGAIQSHTEIVRHFKYHLLLAVGIGTATAVGVWYAEPWIGAVMSGIGGFVTTLAVQVGLWLRRTFTMDLTPDA